jgi:hypothetical protein
VRRPVNHRIGWRDQLRQVRGLLTYDDLALLVGVRLCPGDETPDGIRAHRRGFTERSTVHWAPRRVTPRGVRNFLLLAAQTRLLDFGTLNRAERIGRTNIWAARAALLQHIRLPARYADGDRAKVRWLISQGMDVSPAVQRWARQKGTI